MNKWLRCEEKRICLSLKCQTQSNFEIWLLQFQFLLMKQPSKSTLKDLKLRAMDPSRVAMIDFEWPKTIFQEYVCTEPTKICLNISELLKLLKRAGKDEAVELALDDKTGRLLVTVIRQIHPKLHHANA